MIQEQKLNEKYFRDQRSEAHHSSLKIPHRPHVSILQYCCSNLISIINGEMIKLCFLMAMEAQTNM